MKKILVIGATSAIAIATARLYAQEEASFALVARDPEKLSEISADLKSRGAKKIISYTLDANNFSGHAPLLDQAFKEMEGIDILLIAHGSLGNQKACESSFEEVMATMNTNCLSVLSLLTHVAHCFEKQGYGTIAVISSVAGDRGRQSNYVYGTAKAAVSAFCQGLRNRFGRSKIHVLTIKPGLIDTPMTANYPKGGPLWAEPKTVGLGIKRAIDQKKNVVYLPGFWRGIMGVVKMIPEGIFKRLRF